MKITKLRFFQVVCLLLTLFETAYGALPFEKRIFFTNPASNITQQTFLRFINNNSEIVSVEVTAIDDSGTPAPSGILTFDLPAGASLQLNAQDLEGGNPGKGTSGQLGNGTGKWQLRVSATADIEIMSLIRTPDGFVTSLTDVVPKSGSNVNEAYFANPASNQTQQSFLRVVNRSSATGQVTVSGIDDNGAAAPGGDLTFMLGPNESKQFNSLDYEHGNQAKGLSGALGDGVGKWRLSFSSALELEVLSLIRTPDGFLTNLSGVTPTNEQGDHKIYLANPASNTDQQTFIRVVNTSANAGTVTLSGVDDEGAVAPNGTVQFNLDALESKQMNAQDLENGNQGKGLMGGLGDGNGRWQLTVNSTLDLVVMNMIRTSDGFVTNLSRVASKPSSLVRDVFIVNPGSNPNQRSFIRIVNTSGQPGAYTITAVDDNGDPAPGGQITFDLDASATREISAKVLEEGIIADGLVGMFGNGTGKWRLSISADVDFEVMSLLDTPTGFLTNLSRVTATVLVVNTIVPANNTQLISGPDAITVTLNGPASAASVTAQSVSVLASGGDGTFNDGNETSLSPASTSLSNSDISMVQIDLTNLTLADDTYQVTVSGTGSDNVTDLDGLMLDGDADGNPGGDFTSSFIVASPPSTATLTFIQDNVFTPSCALFGCHHPSSTASGLNLGSGFAFSSIVGINSVQQPVFQRVNPGDPDNSYLIRKVEGNAGNQMPLARPPLAQSVIDNIRQWISNGALNN